MENIYKDLSNEKPENEENEDNIREAEINKDQKEFDEIVKELSEIKDASDLFDNVERLYDFEPISLDKLIKANILLVLFEYAKSDQKYLIPFLKFLRWISFIGDPDLIFDAPLHLFLISLIDPTNPDILIITEIADILGNLSVSRPDIASKIVLRNETFPRNAVDLLIVIIENQNYNNFSPNQKQLLLSVISFFKDLLNIDQFQPENCFRAIVNIGFKYLTFFDSDVSFEALGLLYNAVNPRFDILFEPIISPNIIDILTNVFFRIDSEDFDFSTLSYDFLIDVMRQLPYRIRFLFFSQFSENELILHIQNSIGIWQAEESKYDIFSAALKFVGNLIESKPDDHPKEHCPILFYFQDFILFMVEHIDKNGTTEAKIQMAQIFSKITYLAPVDLNLRFIKDKKFVPCICRIFGISQEADRDLLLALRNLINVAEKAGKETMNALIDSIVLEMGEISELSKLFDDPEDASYEELRNEVTERLNKYIERHYYV